RVCVVVVVAVVMVVGVVVVIVVCGVMVEPVVVVMVAAGVIVGVAGGVVVGARGVNRAHQLGEVLGPVAECLQLRDGVPGLYQAARRGVLQPGATGTGPVVHDVPLLGRPGRRDERRQRQEAEQGQGGPG